MRDMQHEADRIADALRLNITSLDEEIRKIRGLRRRGVPAPKSSARYLEYVRRIHEMSERAKEVGGKGPLFDAMQPIPHRDQLVGFTAEQMQELRWKGVCDDLRTAPAVVRQKIAAPNFERAAA